MAGGPTLPDEAPLGTVARGRLVEMRSELIASLDRDGVDGGVVALLGDSHLALMAIHAAAIEDSRAGLLGGSEEGRPGMVNSG